MLFIDRFIKYKFYLLLRRVAQSLYILLSKMEITYKNILFKKIKGFKYYYVSKCGKIFSSCTYNGKKPQIRKLQNRNGYNSIKLYINNISRYYQVHRLVALAFIPNPENKPYINHKNGIKYDNKIENLEWCTNSENQLHAFKCGLQKVNKTGLGKFGKLNGNSKKVKQLDLDDNLIKVWDSMSDIKRELNIGVSCISSCCSEKKKHVKGFKWEKF